MVPSGAKAKNLRDPPRICYLSQRGPRDMVIYQNRRLKRRKGGTDGTVHCPGKPGWIHSDVGNIGKCQGWKVIGYLPECRTWAHDHGSDVSVPLSNVPSQRRLPRNVPDARVVHGMECHDRSTIVDHSPNPSHGPPWRSVNSLPVMPGRDWKAGHLNRLRSRTATGTLESDH
ncbi:hypothetical protein GCM10010493_22980 [Streptomyces lavendulae subsp. grasserius]